MIYRHATRDRDQAIAKALGTFVRDAQNTADKPADDPGRDVKGPEPDTPCGTCVARGPCTQAARFNRTPRNVADQQEMMRALTVRADDGNRTRMTSLEGSGHGTAQLCLRRSAAVFRCPRVTVKDRGLPSLRARSGHGNRLAGECCRLLTVPRCLSAVAAPRCRSWQSRRPCRGRGTRSARRART